MRNQYLTAEDAGWLVIAPHVRIPAVNGADLLVLGRWTALSHEVGRVHLIFENQAIVINRGEISVLFRFKNRHRSKLMAAVRTLVFGSHYFLEKFVTREYATALKRLTATQSFASTYASFSAVGVWVCDAIKDGPSGKALDELWIETHNDEFKWFGDVILNSFNPVEQVVAATSRRWLNRRMSSVASRATLIHVSDRDRAGYDAVIGPHRHLVIPVGVEVRETLSADASCYRKSRSQPTQLIFVGSLSVKMNADALEKFAKEFWPTISKGAEEARFVVAGSYPSKHVRRLCEENRWDLYDTPSDEVLTDLLEKAHFSVMPFAYVNGGKLKLLKSLSHGVPVLATTVVGDQLDKRLPRCVFSDDARDWLSACVGMKSSALRPEEARELQAAVQDFSWGALAKQASGYMRSHEGGCNNRVTNA